MYARKWEKDCSNNQFTCDVDTTGETNTKDEWVGAELIIEPKIF